MAGQTPGDKTRFLSAEELRKSYRFEEAITVYKEILDNSRDSSIKELAVAGITLSENGINMLEYSTHPSVQRIFDVPAKDFYLYYPDISDSTWILVPLYLNRNKRDYPLNNVMTFDPNSEIFYFSAQDTLGRWDIYFSQKLDSVRWSFPQPLDTTVNSPGNELFPLLSNDGKKLYFSSDGHYGMGGFDLFVSTWDEDTGKWGQPDNLGFPLSSTGNDYLYIDTESGKYSVFASDRDLSSRDSMRIYLLDYENLPVKRPVASIEDAIRIASLKPAEEESHEKQKKDTAVMISESVNGNYARTVREVRKIQSEIDSTVREINTNRALLGSLLNSDDKLLLEKKISAGEAALMEQQSRLRTANLLVQEQEMDFLSKGFIIPREEFFEDQKEKPADSAIKSKKEVALRIASYGTLPHLEIIKPVVLPDLSFRVDRESLVMEHTSPPEGLVYTIQLFMLSNKADIRSFKGLCPVFEEITPSGKYIYTVGRFSTYEELLSAMAKVKSLRFYGTAAKAYNNGKTITIKEAKLLEEKLMSNQSFQVKIEGYPAGIPQPVIDIIRGNTDRDVALKVVEGKNVYYIGPFSNRMEAERLAEVLESISGGITIETIKQD
jgi:hypothetical protein